MALTLSQKSTLAATQSFRDRVYQAIFAKANVYLPQVPSNLEWQKQVNFAKYFVRGAAASFDIQVITRFWLANYNGAEVLDSNSQPTDTEILNSVGLDVVYNTLANVIPGDNALPPEA
jgi:hypothetical protein